MDENHVTGTAKKVGEKTEENFGRIARDAQAQISRKESHAGRTVEDLPGQATDAAAGFTDIVQKTIEQQPYMAVGIAVAVGWLLGRTHRPI